MDKKKDLRKKKEKKNKMKEYIKLSELRLEKTKKNKEMIEIEKNENYIYQIQPKKESREIDIKVVGKLKKEIEVYINKFELNENIECIIISSIYNKDKIIIDNRRRKYDIIKIGVYQKIKEKKIKIGEMKYIFESEKILNEEVNKLIDEKKNILNVKGKYKIEYYFREDKKEKVIELREYEIHIGKIKMMEEMMNCLLVDLEEIIKKSMYYM